MDKLARKVFDSTIYKPKDGSIKVENGFFKNQLHSYIDTILTGKQNVPFRKLANSSIDFVENAIDLMNTSIQIKCWKVFSGSVCYIYGKCN